MGALVSHLQVARTASRVGCQPAKHPGKDSPVRAPGGVLGSVPVWGAQARTIGACGKAGKSFGCSHADRCTDGWRTTSRGSPPAPHSSFLSPAGAKLHPRWRKSSPTIEDAFFFFLEFLFLSASVFTVNIVRALNLLQGTGRLVAKKAGKTLQRSRLFYTSGWTAPGKIFFQ